MKQIQLPPRLALAASFVRQGARLADIGTDHAFLPVWLLQSGRIYFAIAADVVPGPLTRARGTLEKYGCTAAVVCRMSDGFSAIQPGEFDDAVLCGMGGLTILEILKAAHPFRPEQRLILQPQTDIDEVRRWLGENGYTLLEERAVREDGRVYSVILAAYTGQRTRDEHLIYRGRLNPNEYPDDRFFLQKQLHLWQERLTGALQSKKEEDARAFEKAVRILTQALEVPFRDK